MLFFVQVNPRIRVGDVDQRHFPLAEQIQYCSKSGFILSTRVFLLLFLTLLGNVT